MVILGLDTTGNVLSVALSEDTKILGETSLNDTKKHSETLLPVLNGLLSVLGKDITEIGLIAVSVGPGSFTGIRIGVATAKGLAHALNVPVAGIDTLDGLLQNVFFDGTICAIMDARRGQVYAAAKNGDNVLVPSCAIELESLLLMLGEGPVLFVGDGIDIYRETIAKQRPDSIFAAPPVRYQRASSVCTLGFLKSLKGDVHGSHQVRANYLRLSQAERLKRDV